MCVPKPTSSEKDYPPPPPPPPSTSSCKFDISIHSNVLYKKELKTVNVYWLLTAPGSTWGYWGRGRGGFHDFFAIL